MTKPVEFKNDTLAKHNELKSLIKSDLHVVNKTNIEERTPLSTFNTTLPEGLTPDLVEALHKHRVRYNKAATIAVSEVAAETMVADTSIDEMTAKVAFNVPGDAFRYTIERSREFPVPRKEGDPADAPQRRVTKYLHVECTMDASGRSMKSITSAISEEFKDRFVS